ncbi:MAG: chemotaxis protein CheX [Phycisphaerae bacterium]|nr:chemotaxis protein CheX [Phycisphaerae bacterium]
MVETVALEECLWESAKESFATMIMMPIEKAEDFDAELDGLKTIVGSITFSGTLQGAVIMKCASDSAECIAKNMLMMEPEEQIEASEIQDAFGEVVNLVIGGFKSRIAEPIGNIDISVPMVMEGKEMTPATGTGGHKASVFATGADCKLKFIVVYKETA